MKKDSKKDIQKIDSVALFDPDIFQNDLDYHLHDFCDRYQIENIKDITPTQFKAFLQYVSKILINKKTLKDHSININNNNNYIGLCNSNNNRYNHDLLLNDCIDIYVYLCNICNVVITIDGYCKLYNIDYALMNIWSHSDPSSTTFKIYKKLYALNEESIQDNSGNKKYNYVILMAQLNRWHSWATTAAAQGQAGTQTALQAQDLPRLEVIQDNKV